MWAASASSVADEAHLFFEKLKKFKFFKFFLENWAFSASRVAEEAQFQISVSKSFLVKLFFIFGPVGVQRWKTSSDLDQEKSVKDPELTF